MQNGKISQVKNLQTDFGFGSTEFIVFRNRENISDSAFVYYLVISDAVKNPAEKSMSGATGRQRAEHKVIQNFEVDVPDLPTQKKIAGILSGYDDLIENNNRRIKILEEMAQAIYKQWFVDFKFPGHEKVKMVASSASEAGGELGLMPEGWAVKSFEDVGEYVNGFAFNPKHWGESGIPIIKIAELNKGISDSTPYYNGNDIPQKYHITSGDILFAWSASLGAHIWKGDQGYLNQHIFKVLPREKIGKWFLYLTIFNKMPEFINMSLGATMHHIKRAALSQVKLILPISTVMDNFENIVNPLFLEILNLHQQNNNLRQTRDLLLPKIMSEEMEI